MKDQEIFVSIKCAVYNHEQYIRQCLDGIVMQKTNFCFEAIVHDDASTDSSAAIIREYAEKYPHIIKPIYETENQYSKRDGSLTRIMNAACKGKYIAVCEGDDYWIDPLKLQKQVDFMESHPDYSMCFHRARIENETSKTDFYINCSTIEDRDYSGDELLLNWTVPTASIIFKHKILGYKSIRDKRMLYGDIVLILRCAECGKIRGMSSEMSVYRIQNNSVTNSTALRKRNVESYLNHVDFIKESFSCINKSTFRKLYSEGYFEMFKMKKSFKYFLKSISYSPFYVVHRVWKFLLKKQSVRL